MLVTLTVSVPINQSGGSTSCNERTKTNDARLQTLERLNDRIIPRSSLLKERIAIESGLPSRFLEDIDKEPNSDGFPVISTRGNCADCDQIEGCFSRDCTALEILARFLSSKMSMYYAADVNALTGEIIVVHQLMGCDSFNMPAFESRIQEMEKDYKISADTLALLVDLKNRYHS